MPPGAIVLSQTRQVEPQRPSEGPEPGLLETLGAGFTAARADTTGQAAAKEAEAYLEIANEIERLGGPRASQFVNPATGTVSPDSVWRALEPYRRQGRFRELPRTREEFDQQWRERERARIAAAERTAARGNQAAAFVGGVGGSMTDPVNIYTLPLGGFGKTLAGKVLSEAVVGSGTELLMLPTINAERRAMGRDELTTEEAITNIVFAGVGAGSLRLGGEIIGRNWSAIKAAPRDVQERAWTAILDRTPGLRDKIGGKLDWDALDPHLADIAEATIPAERMTDAERGAINALRREAAIDAGNPFVPDGAGTESHYRLLGDALQGIINETPAYVPKVRPNPAARLRSGTSIGSGVAGDAMQTVKSRIGIVESNGSATARNPRSSAMGLYQFTDGTWLAYYKARFGSQGLSDAQIIAKKADTGLQNTLMDDLLADNAKALQEAGFAADPGNLYLAHFAGRKGATKLLEADPATPAVRVLGEAVIEANPHLHGKTAGDVIAWAHGKMGQDAPTGAARAAGGEAVDPFAALDRELADTQAKIARLDAELEQGAGGISDTLDNIAPDARPVVDAEPLARPDGTPAPARIDTPVSATEVAGMTPEARAAIPELRRIVEGERDISLNNPRALSARLGVDERNLQAALQQLAIDGLIVQGRNGNYARLPRRSSGKPMDVLEYVASRGGVTPKGFSQSLMERLPNMEDPPKGHDLGTIFAVERTVRWKRKPDPARGIAGIPLSEPVRTTRSLMIPGYGPIVRNSGRGLDEIGEDLWEAGYFGPMDNTPRPTEREVIDMLSAAAAGKKFYSIDDAGQVADLEQAARASGYADPKNPFASDFQSDEHFDFEWRQFDHAADEAFGITLDEEAFINAWGEYRTAGDGDMRAAVLRAIQREIEDVQAREIAERGMADAADIIEEWEAALRADGFGGGREIPAGRFDPRDPGPSGPPRGPAEWEEDGPLDPERWQAWDEPDGPAAAVDTDSMEHDLRVQVEASRTYQEQFDSPRTGEEAADLLGPEKADPERADWIAGWELGRNGGESPPVDTPLHDGWTVGNNTFKRQGPLERTITLGALAPDASADDMFAAMRDLPDTEISQDLLAAARARLWEEASAEGNLDDAIARFDEARDRWDGQFEATREAEGRAQMAKLYAEQQALANAIADHVNAGRGVMRLSNPVRNTLREYGPDTVRVRNGQLEVVEGRNWVGVPSSSLAEVAGRMGVKLDKAASTVTTAPDGQADFAAPTGAQVRTALERQTEGGIRPTGPQKAPGEDGGLFDTRAPTADLFDNMAFRLDEEGDVVNPADLLAEFDEDAAFIKTIKDCL